MNLARNIYAKTYPRPLGVYKNLIKPGDLAKDFGEYRLIRARPEHIPLLLPTVQDFISNEYTCVGVGVNDAPEEIAMGLLLNTTRYPISFFAVNRSDEVVGFDMQDVVYRNPADDPLPRQCILPSDPNHLFHSVRYIFTPIVAYGEERMFELLGVDRYIQNMIGYVPSSIRGGVLSRLISFGTMMLSLEDELQMGFKYSIGVVTCTPSLKTMEKVHYKLHERIPLDKYIRMDGTSFSVYNNDEPAMLISIDLEEAREKKWFLCEHM